MTVCVCIYDVCVCQPLWQFPLSYASSSLHVAVITISFDEQVKWEQEAKERKGKYIESRDGCGVGMGME